jgi:glucosamine--fructose-6-phosphate aminotransferase (isomerizing)
VLPNAGKESCMQEKDSTLRREIWEQPAVLRRLLATERGAIERAAAQIRARAPRYAMIAARGTSDNAVRYAKYLLGAANGIPVALAAPSLFTVYGRPPRLEGALVIGISQSGASPDIVSVVDEGRRQGALTLAITNTPGSPLAEAAEQAILLHAGEEHSVAATKTYTASLAAVAALSVALAEDRPRLAALQAIPDAIDQVLRAAGTIREEVERYRYMESCVVVGRGYNYATAYEIALKLKELTYVLADSYSAADLKHGPVALVEHGFPVMAIVPEGQMAGEMTDLVQQMRERETETIVVSPLDEALALAHTPLRLPAGIPEWLSPIVAVVPGQVFALGLAEAKGLDPDHPRGLQKITRTR